MPEILTKHPDVVRGLLEKAGGKCGPGQTQEILKQCPPAQFCTVPGGEMCIYGIADKAAMTQISAADLCPGAGTSKAEVAQSGDASCAASDGVVGQGAPGGTLLVMIMALAAATSLARRRYGRRHVGLSSSVRCSQRRLGK
jgi:hypothetical protein